jgi:signal transduction histidine kinase
MRQLRELSQTLRHGGTLSTHAVLHLSWWHMPLFGYLMSFLLVTVSIALVRLLFLREVHFIWIPFCLVSVLVGFVWGTSPALLATLLGFLAFTFFVIPQDTILSPNIWNDIRLLGPFVLAQGSIALLAAQHAVKHRRVLSARREIQAYAQDLACVNRELARASSLKDDFITRAAHELRTPLTTILGETQLALRRLHKACSTAVECQASFEKVETHARSLHALLEDLLTLSSLRCEQTCLRSQTCNFSKLCDEIVAEQQAHTGRQILLHRPAHPLFLQADCDRLSQVVSNLLSNAILYSALQSTIALNISVENECLVLQIHNEGNELSPEQQARLFEPFYRTSFAENTHREGWGLGLTLCQEVVQRHGGRIRVESLPERGTTFVVELPCHRGETPLLGANEAR